MPVEEVLPASRRYVTAAAAVERSHPHGAVRFGLETRDAFDGFVVRRSRLDETFLSAPRSGGIMTEAGRRFNLDTRRSFRFASRDFIRARNA